MKIISDKLSIEELKSMSGKMFGNLVKAVVDIEKGIIAIDGDLHADEEKLLLENGSKQQDLWGINLYPEMEGEDFVEFDSMINLRPSQGNRSRGVDDLKIQEEIRKIVAKIVQK